jgi:hypothetical protein
MVALEIGMKWNKLRVKAENLTRSMVTMCLALGDIINFPGMAVNIFLTESSITLTCGSLH